MNHVFRVVWSACSGCWQVVAETAKGQGKSGGAVRRASSPVGAAALQLKPLVLAVAAALVGTLGYAGPEGGSVARGSASISQSGTTTTINQSSDRAVINWNRFSVGVDESVRFNQPSRTSATLNRVTGAERSEILGSMSANGHVFLLNPNGVLVGKGAQVNVGGFIASSLDMDDDDFMSGKINLKGESVEAVTNDGEITAEEGGTVVLIAPEVNNNGTITANQGSVVLAGTSSLTQGATTPAPAATPTPAPSPAPQSAGAVGSPAPAPVESPAASVPASASSQEAAVAAAPSAPAVPSAPATVSTEPVAPAQMASGGGNTADRFTVRLQDGSNVAFTIDQGAINAMVNNGGLIKAQGGHVILTAKGRDELSKATVNHSGVIEAQTLTTRNGVVELLADMKVGTVNLSGRIDARAIAPASEPSTASATPSRQALRGGFVETSAGKVVIADSARVNTLGSAVNGIQHGNWLIDPQDFTIAANGGNVSGATLAANLQTGDVTIDTQYMGTPGGNGDIFVREEIIIHGPGVVMDGVFDGVDLWYGYIWNGSAPTRLTLRADRNIVFSATPEEVSEYGGTIGGGGGFIEFINGEVDLQPNARGATGGRIYVETYPFGDSSVIANNIYLSTDSLGPGLQRGNTQIDVRVQDQNQVSQVVPMSLDTLEGVSPAPAPAPAPAPGGAPGGSVSTQSTNDQESRSQEQMRLAADLQAQREREAERRRQEQLLIAEAESKKDADRKRKQEVLIEVDNRSGIATSETKTPVVSNSIGHPMVERYSYADLLNKSDEELQSIRNSFSDWVVPQDIHDTYVQKQLQIDDVMSRSMRDANYATLDNVVFAAFVDSALVIGDAALANVSPSGLDNAKKIILEYGSEVIGVSNSILDIQARGLLFDFETGLSTLKAGSILLPEQARSMYKAVVASLEFASKQSGPDLQDNLLPMIMFASKMAEIFAPPGAAKAALTAFNGMVDINKRGWDRAEKTAVAVGMLQSKIQIDYRSQSDFLARMRMIELIDYNQSINIRSAQR